MLGARIPGRSFGCIFRLIPFCVLGLLVGAACGIAQGQDASPPTQREAQNNTPRDLPHGKKLILKDGTYQIVREYQRNGERVRYFSEERGEWEELPAAMVDWEATAKDAEATEKAFNAVAEKIHKQEEAKRMDNVMDIDASLQVGDGAFLPSGEGMFVVEGKSVRFLEQAGAQGKVSSMRTVEQILSPVPLVPGKEKVVLPGAHAKLRLRTTTPEFYLREAPPDPDSPSRIRMSSRQGVSGPEVILIRVKVSRNERQLESIKTLFGEEVSKSRNELLLQRWEVAPTVYRFTLGETLTPGEYVLAEILPGGLNFYVWDFGVDAGTSPGTKK